MKHSTDFVVTGKGYLLDLVARRYPGTRPSDLYGRKSKDNPNGLDELQAFEFDAALAFRYNAIEEDDFRREMHDLKEAIKLTGRFHGLKKLKKQKYKSQVTEDLRTEVEEAIADAKEMAEAGDLIQLTKGTVIDNELISRGGL